MNRETKRSRLRLWNVLCVLFVTMSSARAQTDDLKSDLDQLVRLGQEAPPALLDSIRIRVERDPAAATAALLPRLADPDADEPTLVTYVWVLGLAGDARSADAIMKLAERTSSRIVKGNCLRALASIGGDEAGAFLLSRLRETTEKNIRYGMLNLLAEMQYEPALPDTAEILELDPAQFQYRSVLVYGKMGDKAVSFLLRRLADKNKIVRINAINTLGQWLCPVAAFRPLQDRFRVEKDAEVRGLILRSLQRISPDLDTLRAFAQEVIAEEKDEAVLGVAREVLANLAETRKSLDEFEKRKAVSPEAFQTELSAMLRSAGLGGNYDALSTASTSDDENDLKRLRERILQRDSEAALADYQKVTDIIVLNRLMQTDH